LSMYEERRRGLSLGAASYFRKAEGREVVDRVFRHIQHAAAARPPEILLVEADEATRHEVTSLIDLDGLVITSPDTSVEAVDRLRDREYDCVILAGAKGEIARVDLIAEMQRTAGARDLQVLVYDTAGAGALDIDRLPLREGTVVRCVS